MKSQKPACIFSSHFSLKIVILFHPKTDKTRMLSDSKHLIMLKHFSNKAVHSGKASERFWKENALQYTQKIKHKYRKREHKWNIFNIILCRFFPVRIISFIRAHPNGSNNEREISKRMDSEERENEFRFLRYTTRKIKCLLALLFIITKADFILDEVELFSKFNLQQQFCFGTCRMLLHHWD